MSAPIPPSEALCLVLFVASCASSSPPPAHVEIKSSKSIPTRTTERSQTRPATSGRSYSSGGMSCEEARDAYAQELKIGGKQDDISAGAFGATLNNGAYLNACEVPAGVHVHICAAIQNGHAVGVSVTLTPADEEKANCVSDAVRALTFPPSASLDVTSTTFE